MADDVDSNKVTQAAPLENSESTQLPTTNNTDDNEPGPDMTPGCLETSEPDITNISNKMEDTDLEIQPIRLETSVSKQLKSEMNKEDITLVALENSVSETLNTNSDPIPDTQIGDTNGHNNDNKALEMETDNPVTCVSETDLKETQESIEIVKVETVETSTDNHVMKHNESTGSEVAKIEDTYDMNFTADEMEHSDNIIKSEISNEFLYNDQVDTIKNSIEILLKSLGFQRRTSLVRLRGEWEERVKDVVLDEKLGDKSKVKQCTAIYTSNWPTWIIPYHVEFILDVVTDISQEKRAYYAEVLKYSDRCNGMGAILLQLPDNEQCLQVYKQMKLITSVNPKIKVELDIDDKISNTVCPLTPMGVRLPRKQWLDPHLKKKFRYRSAPTSIDMPNGWVPDPTPNKFCLRLSHEYPPHVAAIKYILNKLSLDYIPLHGEMKKQVTERTQSRLGALSNLDVLLYEKPVCKHILLKNWPTWFEYHHFIYILEIFTNFFDWHYGVYFMDILQYSNGKNMGAALITFQTQEKCLKIFKNLERLHVLIEYEYTLVQLDIDNEMKSKILDKEPSGSWTQRKKLNPVFRNRYSKTSLEMPSTYKEDIIPWDDIKNTTVEIESNVINKKSNPQEIVSIEHDSDNDCTIIEPECSKVIIEINDTDELTKSKRKRLKKKERRLAQEAHSAVVHLKNLPLYTLGHRDYYNVIKDLIKKHTTYNPDEKCLFIRMLRNEQNNLPMDECFLKFDSLEDAQAVVKGLEGVRSTNKKNIEAILDVGKKRLQEMTNCKKLKRKLDTPGGPTTEIKKIKLDDDWGVVDAGTSFMQMEPSPKDKFGLNPKWLAKFGLDNVPLTNTVMVENLHEIVTELKLQEVFSMAGEIKNISFNQEEKFAIIEFDHPVEAVQAISMFHDQKLYNKKIIVTMYEHITRKPLPAGLSSVNSGLGVNGEPLKNVRAQMDLRPTLDILSRHGILKRCIRRTEPLGIHYEPHEEDKSKFVKPTISAAIEAFGQMLVALEFIPPRTNCKDLMAIINALKFNPQLKICRLRNSDQNPYQFRGTGFNPQMQTNTWQKGPQPNLPPISSSQPPNEANNTSVGVLKQVFNDFVQNFPNANNSQQNSAADIQPGHSNIPPGMANINPDLHNVNPNMPNVNPGMPNMNPGMPNMNPGMLNMNSGMPNMNRGMPNMNPRMPNPGMNQFNPGIRNVNPGMPNMNIERPNSNSNMPYVNPRMPNVRPATSNTNSNKPNVRPGMQNLRPIVPNTSKIPKQPTVPNKVQPNRTLVDVSSLKQRNKFNRDLLMEGGDDRRPYGSNQTPGNWKSFKEGGRSKRLLIERDTFGDNNPHRLPAQTLAGFKLPPSVNKAALTKKMQEIGELVFTEITGPGRAIVQFRLLRDAERCQINRLELIKTD